MQADYDKLKSSTDTTIALLENDKQHAQATIESLTARNADLEAQVKAIPAAIATAVGKAKAEVTVNQDAGKK